jgi:excisionase family DNA binding protein
MKSVARACQTPPAGDRLLDAREAAAMLGVSPKTIYQWAYERRIPVVKLFGKALRFRLSTIERLIADSERPALRSLAQRPRDSA